MLCRRWTLARRPAEIWVKHTPPTAPFRKRLLEGFPEYTRREGAESKELFEYFLSNRNEIVLLDEK